MYLETGTIQPADQNNLSEQELHPTIVLENSEFIKPTSWEEFLRVVRFADPRLVAFPEMYWKFYLEQTKKKDQGIRTMMDSVLSRVYELYNPEDAYEISRFYLFITVLTQNNEVRSSSGRDQTVRKRERDLEKNLQPTIKHTTEVFESGLTIGDQPVDAATAMTLKGHDVYEDCGMYAYDEQGNKTDEWIAKDTLLEIIQREFKYGEEVALAILGMSKYENMPEDIRNAAQESLLYKCLEDYIIAAYQKEGKVDELIEHSALTKAHHEDILKTITSIFRLRYEQYLQYQNTGDREAYLTGITRDLYTKLEDITKNLPDVSSAGKLRARQMATLARVLLLGTSNEIMHKLALSTNDALFDTLQNRPLAEKLEDEIFREIHNKKVEQLFQAKGVQTKATIGYRISFIDEAINSEDPPYPAFQTIVEVDPDHYDEVISLLKENVNTAEMKAIVEGNGDFTIEEFSGILQKIIEVLGRRNCMYEIKDSTGQVKHYMRVVEKKPHMWERILLHHEKKEASPEDKFFDPPVDPSKAIHKFINMQLVLFNAEYLKDKGDRIAVLVWDGGVTTCQSIEEMHDLCNRLGITDQDYDFVELMQNARAIDWNNLPQYPYYYAKRKVQPVLNPTGDPSQ